MCSSIESRFSLAKDMLTGLALILGADLLTDCGAVFCPFTFAVPLLMKSASSRFIVPALFLTVLSPERAFLSLPEL